MPNSYTYIFWTPCRIAIIILVATFLCLVGSGITGSSLGAGLESTNLVSSDLKPLMGFRPKGIRSDEWLIATPLAIGQYNHVPQFPVVNTNLGPDGQNMLIVTMTSVPVKHISALGRPATWGFFVFDLKRALAWYWWFPVFGCLFSLWGLFSNAFNLDWRMSFALSAVFTFSPYAVAWSFWPVYTVMFPALALVSVLNMINSNGLIKSSGWATILCLSLLGFVLVLYPAWQVTVGWLFLAFFVGLFFRDRLYKKISLVKAALLGASISIAIAICYVWWVDARDAITAMMNTVYPGQRKSISGGGLSVRYLVLGLINHLSLFTGGMINTNQSESASFIFLLFPLAALVSTRFVKSKHIDSVAASLFLFIAFALFYQYIGFPQFLTEITLWGRTTPARVTLSLGLAQVLLLGYFISDRLNHQSNLQARKITPPLSIFLITTSLTIYLLTKLPMEWWNVNGFYLATIAGTAVFIFASYSLCFERYKLLVCALLIWNMVIALAFNPVSIAPSYFNDNQSNGDEAVFLKDQRVLFLDSQIPAMMLMAAGVPVMNGVFFYPQRTLWKILDPSDRQISIHNRYQHLIFMLNNELSGQATLIRSPFSDLVSVELSGSDFDFKSLPVNYIISGKNNESALTKNRTLKYVKEIDGKLIFRITRP